METYSTQQEILLMMGTTFITGQLYQKDDSFNDSSLTDREQLQQACWNGLLQEMLPEIFEEASDTGPLYLWNIRDAVSFLQLELGEFPLVTERHFSIDPYSFLAIQGLS